MIPFGAMLGREFRRWPPLTAYSLDIAGSISGIAAFALLSTLQTSPFFWFLIVYAVWIALPYEHKRYEVAPILWTPELTDV